MMRQSLRELYGLQGSLWEQYVVFWKRVIVLDFGPSLSAFPTPVSDLIWRALPWTAGLLLVSTTITWVLGNLLGGLAGYVRDSRALRFAGEGTPDDEEMDLGGAFVGQLGFEVRKVPHNRVFECYPARPKHRACLSSDVGSGPCAVEFAHAQLLRPETASILEPGQMVGE